MSKTQEILKMLNAGASQKSICEELHCSKRAVSAIKKKVDDANRSYAEVLTLSDSELEHFFAGEVAKPRPIDPRKDELELFLPEIARRLSQRHANVQAIYESYYLKECPNGYGYTQFRKYVTEYRKNHDYAYHNCYEPGEEWQIDFAGDPLYIVDYKTKERQKLVVLVCVMPYSNLPFMMALPRATTDWFYHGLNRGLEFMGALPKIAKSDNMKQWVSKADRYCPTFSDANLEWTSYYGIEPTACHVRSPRQKASVEGAVNQLYKFVYARLESETHYTLDELNSRILELLNEYCTRPFKNSSRWEIFNTYEKPKMRPLPDTMYRFRMRKEVKLGSSYHVCVGPERHFYSVPYIYVGQMVKVMWDVEGVDIYVNGEFIFHHKRSFVPYEYTTEKSHMPEKHLAYEKRKGVNAATLIEWGANIGPSVKWAIETILEKTTFPQQAYQRCMSVIALQRKYGRTRVNNACYKLQMGTGYVSYKSICNVLSHNLDYETDASGEILSVTPYNNVVRGADAYKSVFKNGKEDSSHD